MLITENDEFDPDRWIIVYSNNEVGSLSEERFIERFREISE